MTIFYDKNYPSHFLPIRVQFTKKSDRKGEKPYDFTHVEHKTKKKQMNIQNKNKLVDTDSRLVVTGGEGVGEGKLGKGGHIHGDGRKSDSSCGIHYSVYRY